MIARDTYLCWDQAELLATLTPREAEAWVRAARGAEHLDTVDPGWARRIEEMLPWLDMSSRALCIGGLCHGDYYAALEAWGLDEEEAHALGLSSDVRDWRAREADYRDLTQVWTTLALMRCGRAP